MTLKDRLQRLRGTLPSPMASDDPMDSRDRPTLAERLARVSLAQARATRASIPPVATLAEALGAQEIAPGVLCLERRLSGRHQHGRTVLNADAAGFADLIDPGWISPAVDGLRAQDGRTRDMPDACAPAGAAIPPDADLVCLDTETSGLSGGTGTWVFVTGLLRWDGREWCLRQYLLTRLDAEPAYLRAIAAELAGARLLATYNGLTFDCPLLSTRLRLSGLVDPLPRLSQLDLLRPVRRAFGRVWSDCRLLSVERRLLGFERQDDLPGAEAPAAWLAWLRAGETHPLSGVLRHNRWDLLSLAALIPRLAEVYRDPSACAADTRAIATYHRAQGRPALAIQLLTAQRAHLDAAGLNDLALLHRRQGDWEHACAIWEKLAASGDADALTELAKYHEHRMRDPSRALLYATRLPPGPARELRCGRLRSKLPSL